MLQRLDQRVKSDNNLVELYKTLNTIKQISTAPLKDRTEKHNAQIYTKKSFSINEDDQDDQKR